MRPSRPSLSGRVGPVTAQATAHFHGYGLPKPRDFAALSEQPALRAGPVRVVIYNLYAAESAENENVFTVLHALPPPGRSASVSAAPFLTKCAYEDG